MQRPSTPFGSRLRPADKPSIQSPITMDISIRDIRWATAEWAKLRRARISAFATKDENKEDGYEVKDYVWKDASSGYYWAGGVVVGDRIYYAGDKGKLYCHHLTRDIVYDTFDVGGRVRST